MRKTTSGRSRSMRSHQLAEDAPEHRQVAQDVEQSDDAHLARVMEERHPLAREQIAADAERLQRRIELLQLADDFGRVEIAGGLAGDDGELHRSAGTGTSAQPSAIPPKKSEQKMTRKKRMRSRRALLPEQREEERR